MAEKKKYNSILISGRKDQTLTYSKYVKDEESGESVKESLDKKVNVTDKLETQQIKDGAITNEKMAAGSVGNTNLQNGSVSNEKLEDGSITNEKLAENSITKDKLKDNTIGVEKLDQELRQAINAATGLPELEDGSITNEKLAENSITKDKLKDNTIGVEKLDQELRQAINAATGLPEDLVETIQNVDVSIAKLNDTVYPITLGFTIIPNVDTMQTEVRYSVSSDNKVETIQNVDVSIAKLNDTVYPITLGFTIIPNVDTMQTEVRYSVSSDNKPLVPDTLEVSKRINEDMEIGIIASTPVANGSLTTPIQGAREIFKFVVTKKGRTGKNTSQTRYLCYFGGNSADTMTAEILNTLNKVSATGVSFNPKVTTKDNDYIWLVVPSYLSISRVASAGFDVTLAAPQTITNNLGSFKAYRTANPLTAATWNLVIS